MRLVVWCLTARSVMSSDFLLSVVVPVFNEEEGLNECINRLQQVMSAIGCRWEIVFVNDGSRDGSLAILKNAKETLNNITVIDLSRNFGHQVAITAGIDFAKGDAIVTIDADMQDPPELIPELVAKWQEGYDVVHARRKNREGETIFKLWTATLFYRIVRQMSDIDLPVDVGDYRLISTKAAKALCTIREQHRYIRGLIAWLGFKQTFVDYDRRKRFAGGTKYSLIKMIRLSMDAVTAFSVVPLRLASLAGIFSAALAVFYLGYALYVKFILKTAVLGWTSVIFAVLGIGGIQLICLGIMGEYLGMMYSESKHRPLYLVNEII